MSVLAVERRVSRLGAGGRAHAGAVFAARRLRCGTRFEVAPNNSLRSLRSLRSDTFGESEVEAREYARRPRSSVPRRPRNRPAARAQLADARGRPWTATGLTPLCCSSGVGRHTGPAHVRQRHLVH
jgi:hypothetical protein